MHKSIYKDRNLNTTIILLLISALMVGFSLYMTQHYFELKFPTGLEGKSICNINAFFNCDKTTFSPFSNIFGVPVALFGALIGFFVMVGLIFKNENYERTIYFTLFVNFLGCLLLLFYSLFILGGLCPFCTVYYILSGLALFLFYKRSSNLIPDLKHMAAFAVVVIIVSLIVKSNVDEKIKKQSDIAQDLIKQYYSLPNLGSPKIESEFKIASAPNAPIKMAIFSDFECPACKALSEQVPQLASRYAGKIEIQYFYYPLDNSCNPSMERPMHQYACKAAYAASCMPVADFARVHDEIFQNQDKFEAGYIDQFIKKNNLSDCVARAETKEKVVSLIKAADPFNIRSTPTYLLNGVKIEGVLPNDQMFAILDEIVKRAGR